MTCIPEKKRIIMICVEGEGDYGPEFWRNEDSSIQESGKQEGNLHL